MYREGLRKILFAGAMIYSNLVFATTTVALLDTGYNPSPNVKLCKYGHYDATTNRFGISPDSNGHGTIMAKTIAQYAKNTDYCIVIIKIFSIKNNKAVTYLNEGLIHAHNIYADVVNISFNGEGYSKTEHYWLKQLTNINTKVFVTVGNDSKNLDINCSSYPACYEDLPLVVVGAKGELVNTGKIIKQYEDYCTFDTCGSSNATAIATGKYVYSLRKRH